MTKHISQNDIAIIHLADQLSRHRALTNEETSMLAGAIERTREPIRPRWSRRDDIKLRRMLRTDKTVAEMANELSRTTKAVTRRIARMRAAERARNGSMRDRRYGRYKNGHDSLHV